MSNKNPQIEERLKQVRNLLGYSTQTSFASVLQISLQTYANYEKGERSLPDDLKTRLCEEFGINLTWLITGSGEPFITEKKEEKPSLVLEVEKIIDNHIGEKTEQRFESIEYQLKLLKQQYEKLNQTGECELCDIEPVYGAKMKIPFVENIAAGPPIEQTYTQGTEVEIPARLIHGNKEDFYAARVSGDSMTEAGIFNGEIILIKKSGEPVHGKIQVVRYMSKSTLKRVCKNGDLWELHFEDGTNRVIQVRENDYQIQGDFVSVIGKFVNFD